MNFAKSVKSTLFTETLRETAFVHGNVAVQTWFLKVAV